MVFVKTKKKLPFCGKSSDMHIVASKLLNLKVGEYTLSLSVVCNLSGYVSIGPKVVLKLRLVYFVFVENST